MLCSEHLALAELTNGPHIAARLYFERASLSKQGKALWVSPTEVSVLTDAYTVASIDVNALRKA